ncbi:hypothetical protein MRB53_016712 [Persea americana]|uniref:Uncharacterized protein n=1 Tax=Persea americana TaxID=3435 RepID=A0ACC2M3I0_PERAE|nr:hypothetical protein MRB53_016712 [Persea americana]
MALKRPTSLPCPIPTVLLSFSLLCILSLLLFFFFFFTSPPPTFDSSSSHSFSFSSQITHQHVKVYVADLPRSLNYGLLDRYWSLNNDSRLGSDADADLRRSLSTPGKKPQFPPYPESPLIKQYSAEYWILGDLLTPEELRGGSFAKRVFSADEADVVFVPFFATLSAEMQLGMAKGAFRKKVGNEDYERQRKVVDLIRGTDAWKRSGGRDHVFVLTDPVAMWHVRVEIAPAVLLVVDFGGWYRLDAKSSDGNTSDVIHHSEVSLIKDVIVPYTHLLPKLHSSENQDRKILLYFKGAKHRHRGGLIRAKLWDLLVDEPDVIMEEGFPNATGREQSIKGMRTSEFCLHPAGDTPTSCRLFDAIISLCIPVIVSDNIELPFEGILDYSNFSVFVSTSDALQPSWLVAHLRSFSKEQKDGLRQNMARAQPMFRYDNGHPGGIGPIPPDGAVNYIWKKVHQKLPMIKEAIIRDKRKPPEIEDLQTSLL